MEEKPKCSPWVRSEWGWSRRHERRKVVGVLPVVGVLHEGEGRWVAFDHALIEIGQADTQEEAQRIADDWARERGWELE